MTNKEAEKLKTELAEELRAKYTFLKILKPSKTILHILPKTEVLSTILKQLRQKDTAVRYRGYYLEADLIIRDPTPENIEKFHRYAEAASEDDPTFFKRVTRKWNDDEDENLDIDQLREWIYSTLEP